MTVQLFHGGAAANAIARCDFGGPRIWASARERKACFMRYARQNGNGNTTVERCTTNSARTRTRWADDCSRGPRDVVEAESSERAADAIRARQHDALASQVLRGRSRLDTGLHGNSSYFSGSERRDGAERACSWRVGHGASVCRRPRLVTQHVAWNVRVTSRFTLSFLSVATLVWLLEPVHGQHV